MKDRTIQNLEDESVAKLLGGLNRVEAPNDFDFRVRARIVKGKPADKTASWLPASVRYALPLFLLLLIGGYFAFNALYSTNNLDVPAVAQEQKIEDKRSETTPSNGFAVLPPEQITANRGEVKLPEPTIDFPQKESEKRVSTPASSADRRGGGSYVEASNQSRRILPRGFDPNVKIQPNPKGFDRNVQIPANEILTLIGVTAAFTGDGWKAEVVAPNSVAERSGVKAGDVIEAINDQPLTGKTVFGGRFNGRNLRVRRDGKSVLLGVKH